MLKKIRKKPDLRFIRVVHTVIGADKLIVNSTDYVLNITKEFLL